MGLVLNDDAPKPLVGHSLTRIRNDRGQPGIPAPFHLPVTPATMDGAPP